ncbi:MAG: hypothetical protein IKL69_02900 [Paludibacteraceae bacterium]|nr:hypothetical protein [Paludibacteraceae bacterium]
MKKLFFALITSFIFVATAWGQCTKTETIPNFRVGNATGGGFNYDDKTKEYTTNLNSPIVSFTYEKTAWGASGIEWRIDEKIDGQWVVKFKDENGSGSATVSLSRGTRTFRFVYSGNFAGDFSNIKITQGSYLEFPTDSKDFGVVSLNSDNNKTIKVEYSSITSDLTVKLAQQDNVFSTSLTGTSTNPVTIAYADCSYGSKDITIYFKPTEYGVYTNQLEFSNGTKVFLRGECSHDFDSKAANFTVEKVSYTSIKLKWNAVPGASGYRIVNQTNGASYTVDANTTSLNATGLKMETNYSFVFYALFNGATSLNATLVSATTLKKEGVVIEDCPKFYENYDAKEQTIGVVGYNKPMIYDNISITGNLPSYKVRFRAKMTTGSVVGKPDLCMYVKLKGKDNYEPNVYWEGRAAGLDDTHREYFVEVPQNTVAIKFDCDENGATLTRHVDDLYIFRENILEADKTELDFGEVKPNEYKDLSVNLTYSNVAKLEAMLDSEYFTVQSFKETAACTDGTQQVVIRFQPTACFSEYEESLTIFNGQELGITLKGKLITNPGTVNEITWTGEVDTNWDNRNNWVKEDGTVLSAADVLSENLVVTLPAGKDKYPTLPDVSTEENFKTVRDNACDCAQVNAGDNATATKVADKIIMESGAALVGVETLNSGNTPRYTEVQMNFTPERYSQSTGYYEWSLVGPVVKPWDEENPNQTRDVLSGDYYKNDLPHVYMHEAVMTKDGEDYIQTWDNSFASLTVNIPHNKAFAIRMPNQYGRNSSGYGIPASIYNKRNNTSYEAKENITFAFTGRFYNEAGLPIYTGLTPEVPVLLNNTYPANIDADMLQSKGYGTIQCYEGHSFVDVTGRTDAVISSGYGFIFTPNVAEFTIPSDCFQTTKVINNRNAEAEVPSLRLQLKNEDVDGVYSTISISHDELKDDAADYAVDAPKLFNDMESNLADLYVMRYDSKWAGLSVPTVEESLPLGIKVRTANQKHRFNLLNSNLDYDIILEDRQEGKEYNLSAGDVCEVSNLAVGDCRGRFYLKTSESSEEDDEVTTDILDNEKSASIDIYAQGNSVVVSSTNNVNIQKIVVSDLSGRQMNYNVSGQYIVLDLPVSSGIYTINVMGDTANRIEKIKLN